MKECTGLALRHDYANELFLSKPFKLSVYIVISDTWKWLQTDEQWHSHTSLTKKQKKWSLLNNYQATTIEGLKAVNLTHIYIVIN